MIPTIVPCFTFIYTSFFSHATSTTEIYTLSLHDALPISPSPQETAMQSPSPDRVTTGQGSSEAGSDDQASGRSEEHTSELQSLAYLVCRLLLEKKNSAACRSHRRCRRSRRCQPRSAGCGP